MGAALVFGPACHGQITQAAAASATPGQTITGTVFDPSGALAPGVEIIVEPQDGMTPHTMSDANGRYALNLEQMHWGDWSSFGGGGVYWLVARDLEHRAFSVPHLINYSMTNMDLALRPAVTISARVVDSTGKPVTNAEGNADWMRRNLAIFGFSIEPSMSDAQGLMVFKDMPQSDRYALHITADGYLTAQQEMQAPTLQTNHLDFPTIVLRLANKKLAGKVLDADGKPVAGVPVSAVIVSNIFQPSPDQPETGVVTQVFGPYLHNAQTDDEGRFFFDAVCEGPIQLSTGLRAWSGEVQTIGGDTNVVLHLKRNDGNLQ